MASVVDYSYTVKVETVDLPQTFHIVPVDVTTVPHSGHFSGVARRSYRQLGQRCRRAARRLRISDMRCACSQIAGNTSVATSGNHQETINDRPPGISHGPRA